MPASHSSVVRMTAIGVHHDRLEQNFRVEPCLHLGRIVHEDRGDRQCPADQPAEDIDEHSDRDRVHCEGVDIGDRPARVHPHFGARRAGLHRHASAAPVHDADELAAAVDGLSKSATVDQAEEQHPPIGAAHDLPPRPLRQQVGQGAGEQSAQPMQPLLRNIRKVSAQECDGGHRDGRGRQDRAHISPSLAQETGELNDHPLAGPRSKFHRAAAGSRWISVRITPRRASSR
jgi:hypothetical protein